MTPPAEGGPGSPTRVELVQFLDDLRRELNAAQRGAQGAAEAEVEAGASDYILMRLEKTTVTLEVEYSRSTSGEAGGKVGGKFWVFGFAEASASTTGSRERHQTQTIVLELTPDWFVRSDDAGEPDPTKKVLLTDAAHRGPVPPGFRRLGRQGDGHDDGDALKRS